MTLTRNEFFDALLDLSRDMTWNVRGDTPQAFVIRSRMYQSLDQVGANSRPALFQVEPKEGFSAPKGGIANRLVKVLWVIYLNNAGVCDPDVYTPAHQVSDVLDAIEKLFSIPLDYPEAMLQLNMASGSLAYRAWIDGEVIKDAGELTDQAVIMVPISIRLP